MKEHFTIMLGFWIQCIKLRKTVENKNNSLWVLYMVKICLRKIKKTIHLRTHYIYLIVPCRFFFFSPIAPDFVVCYLFFFTKTMFLKLF